MTEPRYVTLERVRGPDHKYTAWVRVDLAQILIAQNRLAEARELLVRALPHLEHTTDLQYAFRQGMELLRKTEVVKRSPVGVPSS